MKKRIILSLCLLCSFTMNNQLNAISDGDVARVAILQTIALSCGVAALVIKEQLKNSHDNKGVDEPINDTQLSKNPDDTRTKEQQKLTTLYLTLLAIFWGIEFEQLIELLVYADNTPYSGGYGSYPGTYWSTSSPFHPAANGTYYRSSGFGPQVIHVRSGPFGY